MESTTDTALFLTFDDPSAVDLEAVRASLASVDGVERVEVERDADERERSVVQTAETVTAVLTATAGTAGAAALLLDQLKNVLASVKGLRDVAIQTHAGPKPLADVQPDDVAG